MLCKCCVPLLRSTVAFGLLDMRRTNPNSDRVVCSRAHPTAQVNDPRIFKNEIHCEQIQHFQAVAFCILSVLVYSMAISTPFCSSLSSFCFSFSLNCFLSALQLVARLALCSFTIWLAPDETPLAFQPLRVETRRAIQEISSFYHSIV